jgi:hypothetical protein
MKGFRGNGAGFARLACGFALAFGLTGCTENLMPSAPAIQPQAFQPSIQPSGASPHPAALSVTQMDGAPAPLQNQFMAYFNADVLQQDVALTDSASARYVAKGYISAYPVDGGARLAFVWDIYDRANKHAQRLNDEIALKGAALDPWSLVDGEALAALATRSARELAAYLSNTPEALAAAPQPAQMPIPAQSPAPAGALPTRTMSYAPVR